MGAKVLLEVFRKFGDVSLPRSGLSHLSNALARCRAVSPTPSAQIWLVELLFDDLLDWNNWSLRERTMEPLGLIVLGTSQGTQSTMEAMQSARYESGLDDSPM